MSTGPVLQTTLGLLHLHSVSACCDDAHEGVVCARNKVGKHLAPRLLYLFDAALFMGGVLAGAHLASVDDAAHLPTASWRTWSRHCACMQRPAICSLCVVVELPHAYC